MSYDQYTSRTIESLPGIHDAQPARSRWARWLDECLVKWAYEVCGSNRTACVTCAISRFHDSNGGWKSNRSTLSLARSTKPGWLPDTPGGRDDRGRGARSVI